MLHPSYTELMQLINEESEDDTPVVNSRYSIVMATAKRARQIIAGEANVSRQETIKPIVAVLDEQGPTAVAELQDGLIRILPSDADEEDRREIAEMASKFIDSSLSVGADLDSDDELDEMTDSDEYGDDYDPDSDADDEDDDDDDEEQE